MEYRRLGQSDLVTSVIGFGGFPIGRGQYGPFDDDEAIRGIHRAIDLGVTLIDTAARYGFGEGEKLVGRALKGRRDEVVLVSKGSTAPDKMAADLEGSLERLQTDYLDLYLIHWPDASVPIADSMEAMAKFQQQGKIRYGGVSNFSAAQLGECLETFPLVTEQIGYHLFDRRPEAELFPFCQERGLGVMAYGPMAHGLLTGTMTPETTFGEDDFRSRGTVFELPLFEREHFLRYLQRVDRLKEAARDRGFTVAQLALAWVIANPIVSVALAGTKRPEEIEQNVRAVEWRMTENERAELSAIAAGE